MGKIIDTVEKTILDIKLEGHKINGTLEKNNIFTTFYPHQIDMGNEELEIYSFYQKYVGDWRARQELEKNHYKFLTASIIHKIGEVQYFHKGESLTSRKFIIFSGDCIGAIQFLHRNNKNILNIFIRSSDAFNLLLSDYLFGCKLLDSVLEEFNINKNASDEVNFFTTSCHWYEKDEEKINQLLNRKNKKLFNYKK